jgi:hypothetical protein
MELVTLMMAPTSQQEEAIKRHDRGEPARENPLSYNLIHSTISRLVFGETF